MKLRKSVQWFAEMMERRLRENSNKGGWRGCDENFLFGSAHTNLKQAEYEDPEEKTFKIQALADCANFCMMIADNEHRKGARS